MQTPLRQGLSLNMVQETKSLLFGALIDRSELPQVPTPLSVHNYI